MKRRGVPRVATADAGPPIHKILILGLSKDKDFQPWPSAASTAFNPSRQSA